MSEEQKEQLTKEEIREVIQQELKAMLVRTIKVEKAHRPGEGSPGNPPHEGKLIEEIEVNVLEWFTSYLPYLEGALRGMQIDVGKVNTKMGDTQEIYKTIEAMRNIFLGLEDSIKEIARLAAALKPMLEIEYNEGTDKRRHTNQNLLD